MIFGKKAFENSNKDSEEVFKLLRKDIWEKNEIEKFIQFWSLRLWLTIGGMDERIKTVYTKLLNATNPSEEAIRKNLKTKSPRWKNKEVKRIAKIVEEFLIRKKNISNIVYHHTKFQEKLKEIGPVYTIWCHYLINPKSFPPIDKFNYAAYIFINSPSSPIPKQVPNNFSFIPIECNYTDYQKFRQWFLGILKAWKNNNYSVKDLVNLDKSLMSLGAFILKNSARGKI